MEFSQKNFSQILREARVIELEWTMFLAIVNVTVQNCVHKFSGACCGGNPQTQAKRGLGVVQ